MKTYAFPGIIEDDILRISAGQIPYMRTSWFSGVMKENERMLLDAIGCQGGRVMFFTSSGTAAMESVVQNYVAAKGSAFIIDGGTFGHRWVQLCEYHGIEHEVMQIPFAEDIDYEALEQRVACSRPAVFLCQHHETSSGQLFDIRRISDICHKFGTSLVVDVISSFLAEELDMNGMGIDVAVTSTQKGLNLPPGAALVFLAENALKVDFRHNNYYLDFQDNLKNLERGQTPFTPAVGTLLQINARLKEIEAAGGAETERAKIAALAADFRERIKDLPLDICSDALSNAVTPLRTRNCSAYDIFTILKDEYQIWICPNGGAMKDIIFRVGHIGALTTADNAVLSDALHDLAGKGILK